MAYVTSAGETGKKARVAMKLGGLELTAAPPARPVA